MEITIYTYIIWATAFLIAALDIVLITGSKNISSKVFAVITFLTAVWVASQGFLISISSVQIASFLIRIQFLLGLMISLGFYYFSYQYPIKNTIPTRRVILLIACIFVFGYILLFTNSIISGVYEIGGNGRWAWRLGYMNIVFVFAFCLIWFITLRKLYLGFSLCSGKTRVSSKNVFLALSIGIIPPTLLNIVFPTFGYYELNWLGPISSIIWISIIAYSITRHHLFNTKIIMAHALTFSLSTMLLIRTIATNNLHDLIIQGALFIISIMLGVMLIRGVFYEIEQREKVERITDQLKFLNLHLEQRVSEQTQEIRHAYEVEKKARADLEKLNDTKDQFIMITQHHLRTPVTSIMWGLESSIKGMYGEVQGELKLILGDLYKSSKRLMQIVDDFLNITAIKAGTNILDISHHSLKPALEDVLDLLKGEISRTHVKVTYSHRDEDWPIIMVDYNKIREVLLVILENAVRYNHDHGSISLSTEVGKEYFCCTVENTGVGMSAHELEKVGSSLFFRGEYARSAYPIGMGIGMSVSKAIIRAHRGELTIHSDGKDKGARVTLRLPMIH